MGRGLTILSVLANDDGAGNLEGPLTVDDAGEDFYRQLIHSRDSSIGKRVRSSVGGDVSLLSKFAFFPLFPAICARVRVQTVTWSHRAFDNLWSVEMPIRLLGSV